MRIFMRDLYHEIANNTIVSFMAWKEAGKTRFGVIFTEYKINKLIYKKHIREGQDSQHKLHRIQMIYTMLC